MALKFLNKKGWHTGSLRNIENVWKAEQKHEAEQRKLEELRKQIHEERERAEFRQLQVQAGLIPKQERLDFLYESGLAVGKGSSSFKELESLPKTEPEITGSSSASEKQPAVPGALFEEKPQSQSANDSWRKLHSDPLLLIRQREQQALARVKNNPVQMAMIRKSVEAENDKDVKKQKKKHHKKKSKHRKHSSSEEESDYEEKRRENHHKSSNSDKPSSKRAQYSDEETSEDDARRKKYDGKGNNHRKIHKSPQDPQHKEYSSEQHEKRSQYDSNKPPRNKYHDSQHKEYSSERHEKRTHYNNTSGKPPRNKYHDSEHKKYSSERHEKRSHYNNLSDKPLRNENHDSQHKETSSERQEKRTDYNISSDKPPRKEPDNRNRKPVKLSEEERAARLREMQTDAEIHEQQRWKRLKKAADSDALEAVQDRASLGRSFLDATQKSIYGADKGGSKTIEESVRRRMHYSQGRLASDSNAFRPS
ncbi:hypothetical protein CASFOL_028552 [Castilleja foliolosa]|uniref:CBF1-interacting co-repressor CIR N-terminal domain-containing protein n=1 Tax=Castilleja foliolosa TaxID=1961234 RepID=A0ABD3CCY8_9LAMI